MLRLNSSRDLDLLEVVIADKLLMMHELDLKENHLCCKSMG